MKIVGYFSVLIVLGIGVVAGAWYWKNFVSQPMMEDIGSLPAVTPTDSTSVLGVSDEIILPTTLYGLVNGLRREEHSSQLSVNLSLEKTAQRLLDQPDDLQIDSMEDASELAKSLGFSGKSVTEVRAHGNHSSWTLFTELQTDPRTALLLKSPSFSEFGVAIRCLEDSQPPCTVLVLMGQK